MCTNAIKLFHVSCFTAFVKSIQPHLLPPTTFYRAISLSKLLALSGLHQQPSQCNLTYKTKMRCTAKKKKKKSALVSIVYNNLEIK